MNLKKILFVAVGVVMALPVSAATTHRVAPSQNLGSIADQYFNQSAAYLKDELVKDLIFVNNLGQAGVRPGQELSVPVCFDEALKPVSRRKPAGFEAKGLYLNRAGAGSRKIFRLADRLAVYGGNAIVFDAKDVTGQLSYRSRIPATFASSLSYQPSIEDLAKLIEYLHSMDMHVIARVSCFSDQTMASLVPSWRIKENWINPASASVQDYTLGIINELAKAGVDEIQLDYVRYPADGSSSTGVVGRSRSDVIAGFLKRAHEVTKSRGILLSIDMFGIVIWGRQEDVLVVGQDITKIMKNVDIISPMVYPSHFQKKFGGVADPANEPYYMVFQSIKRLKAIVGDTVVIRPWLQAFPLGVKNYGPEYLTAQMRAARDAGATGWLWWSPGNYYDEAFAGLDAMLRDKPQRVVTATPAAR
ncbi:MAG: hypothetical protein BWY87_00916 [Deltaproteobacteria bacterium ADurb.Bin510]|nr:MAG: hypothetical protein BWY87_00916 [Deltaproteobacteria bacterium ADurb.Bin510]